MNSVKKLKPSERLIVSFDLPSQQYGGRKLVEQQIFLFAKMIKHTGVVLKFNSLLLSLGYGLILDIRDLGIPVFADLKLYEIEQR